MAWIKNGKIYEIVKGASKTNTMRKLKEQYLSRGYKQHGEIKKHGQGYGVLVYKKLGM